MALGFNRSKQQGEMSTPVIVQGVAVPQQQYGTGYATATPAYGSDDSPNVGKQYNSSANSGGGAGQSENFDGVKGEVQPARFNDVMFSIAFIAHLLAVTIMGAIYGQGIGNGGGGGYHSYAMCAVVCGLFAMGLSSMALGFMMKFPTELIKTGLFFSIGLSLTIGILGLISGQILMAVMGLLSSVIGCCYAYFVWSRIPFAAANMNTALTAVKANMGLTMVAYFFLLLAFAWSVWWAIAAGGITAALGQGGLFFLFVSYYWTHQVLQVSNLCHECLFCFRIVVVTNFSA